VHARVFVIAGPSGSGKSRLAQRLGLPVLNLDDFYKEGTDPSLPRIDHGLVDWDDPASWLEGDAVRAIEQLCRDGAADVPIYDISHDGRVGEHRVALDGAAHFVAEGIFAHEVVDDCVRRGLLAAAVCVSNHPLVTFWRRLTRDLRERRKPPLVLLRRGLRLLRQERQVVARAVRSGCEPMPVETAYRLLRAVADGTATAPVDRTAPPPTGPNAS
jgi:uridine kinase